MNERELVPLGIGAGIGGGVKWLARTSVTSAESSTSPSSITSASSMIPSSPSMSSGTRPAWPSKSGGAGKGPSSSSIKSKVRADG
jgi:hypothetical protein